MTEEQIIRLYGERCAEYCPECCVCEVWAMHDLIETQAREIERMREVLRRWQYSGCPNCNGDCGSANPPVMCCIMEETRAALGDSHD